MTKNLALVSILLSIAVVGNCAFMDKKNRRITNAMDENITPSTESGRLIASPLAIPLGATGLVMDTFLLQPVIAIPHALDKTIQTIWLNPQGGIILQSFLFIPKIIFTPITFSVLWLRYAFFR